MIAFWPLIVLKSLRRRLGRVAITLAATAFAVAGLVVLESIMVAVGDTMILNSVAVGNGHVLLSWQGGGRDSAAVAQTIRDWAGVEDALPRRVQAGLLSTAAAAAPVTVLGVVPRESGRTLIGAKIIRGAYPSARGTILLGEGVAVTLGASPGGRVQLAGADGTTRAFTVCGIFSTHLAQLDAQTAVALIEDLPTDRAAVAVFLHDPEDAQALAVRAAGAFGVAAAPWQKALPHLWGLIALQRFSMNVVLGLALLILAFGISNNVFLSVSQRRRELSILRAMGLTARGVMAMVLGETMLMACCAAVVGAGVGAAAAGIWSHWGMDLSAWTTNNPNFLMSAVVYPRLTVEGVVWPAVVACACGLLAAFLPARRAGRAAIVEGLRSL